MPCIAVTVRRKLDKIYVFKTFVIKSGNVLSFFKKGLIVVAVCSCAAVLMTELCMIYVF